MFPRNSCDLSLFSSLRRVKKNIVTGAPNSKFADKKYRKLDHVRKIYAPGAVYFVTTRMQEGLPMVAAEYMQFILNGIIARATLFNVSICHQIIMSNHWHALLIAEDAGGIPKFVGYIKRESSHAINRLLITSPHDWMDCYEKTKGRDIPELREELKSRIREREAELREKRAEKDRGVLGVKALKEQSIKKKYEPKNYSGKRCYCHSKNKKLRILYISWVKRHLSRINPDNPDHPPIGAFAPGGILYTTILPWCVPISSRYNLIDTDI